MSLTIGPNGPSVDFYRAFVGVIDFFPATVAPAGYIKANGVLLNRISYSALWAFAQASGNMAASDGVWVEGQFSPGDGSTTFRIPDYRGLFVRSLDDGKGTDVSRVIGTKQLDQFQSHRHALAITTTPSLYDENGGAAGPSIARIATTNSVLAPTVDGANGTPRVGTETRPVNVSSLACIFIGT